MYNNALEQIFKNIPLLLDSGLGILEIIKLFGESSQNQKEKDFWLNMQKDLEEGRTLADSCLERKLNISLSEYESIKCSETAGILSECLNRLGKERDENRKIKQNILQAMIYPLMTLIVSIILVSFLVFYIFPKIIPVISSMKIDIPIPTRIVIFSIGFIKSNIIEIILAITIFFSLIFFSIKKSKNIKLIYENLMIRLPIVSSIYKDYYLILIFSNMNMLLSSNISIEKIFSFLEKGIKSLLFESWLKNSTESIIHGQSVHKLIYEEKRLFEPMIGALFHAGEESGRTKEASGRISEIIKERLERKIKNLSGLIEPILLIFLGSFVVGIALSIVLPIYSITNNIK